MLIDFRFLVIPIKSGSFRSADRIIKETRMKKHQDLDAISYSAPNNRNHPDSRRI